MKKKDLSFWDFAHVLSISGAMNLIAGMFCTLFPAIGVSVLLFMVYEKILIAEIWWGLSILQMIRLNDYEFINVTAEEYVAEQNKTLDN